MLEVFRYLQKKGIVDALYIIAPLKVCLLVWPLEVEKWANFNGLTVRVLHGTKKDKLITEEADIYILNPDGLEWFSKHTDEIYENSMLVIDESTKFKHSNTKRFKTLKKLLPLFCRRYILTGSPIPNGMLDLFGQIYILDEGASLGRYITHYKQKFFYPSGYNGYDWQLGDGMDEVIFKKIKPLIHRLDAKDHLTLPPLIIKDVVVELPKSAMKIYKDIEKEFITELKEGTIIANNAAVASSKCRQVANGGVYFSDPETGLFAKEYMHIHDEKIKACIDLVEELSGRPALIAYETKHDLARLQKAFPKAPSIGGHTKSKDVIKFEKDWNNNKIPVGLVQPASVAHGLNLQEGGEAIIWHSLTYNLEFYEQLYQRVYRQGQKKTVYMYHIIAKGTIDPVILRAIASKDEEQKSFLQIMKDEYL
jgi:SNF2 family DNA or RNA helicase